jgi:hypothetical protein
MSALDQLRALEIFREAVPPEPSKPTKAPFDGFVGAPPAILPNIRGTECVFPANDAASDPTGVNKLGAHRAWRVSFPKLDPMEVLFTPEATHAAVASIYPGAAIEPVIHLARRRPTQAEADELRALIQAVTERDRWPADEIEGAISAALADPDDALTSWRASAAEQRFQLHARPA